MDEVIQDAIDQAMEMADESQNSFFLVVEESMKKIMEESYRAPKDMYEHWCAFTSAINWHERFITCLFVFHVILFLAAVSTRKSFSIQVVLFMFVCLLVYISEYLNSYGALRWKDFATQNYFDSHGAFMGIFFNAPLLMILFLQMVSLLRSFNIALHLSLLIAVQLFDYG